MKKKTLRLMIGALAVTMMAGSFAGCGNKGQGTSDGGDKTSQTQKLAGTIEIDGSSTVAPITEAMAETFNQTYPDVRIPVKVSGTGGGFKRFTAGEIDISDASRPIKDEEKKIAEQNSIQYVDLTVAYDGITVCVNKDNKFVDSLTTAELKKIWEPDSKVKTWKDVRPEWPAEAIKLYSMGSDSGTFEFFTEAVNGKAKAIRSDINPSVDPNTLVQGIAGDKNAIGYFGHSYYEANKDKLKAVKVDAGNGAVEPTIATIKDGTYKPLSRPIYIYVKKSSLEKPEVKEFVNFYMNNAAKLVPQVGYVELQPDQYKEQLNKLK
jgi:phosphate transport system substrate-binding protein